MHRKISILLAVQLLLGHAIRPLGPLRKVVPIEEVTVHLQLAGLGVHQGFLRCIAHRPQLLVGFLVELQRIAIGLGAASRAAAIGRLVVDLLDGTTNGLRGGRWIGGGGVVALQVIRVVVPR